MLHWLVPVHRQVRVAGPAERVSEDEADEYWSTRARAVRLSAAASRQSRVVASRTVLETQVRETLRRHPDGAGVPRPQRWGGFRVLPSRVEFWQESPDGLHGRIRYRPGGDALPQSEKRGVKRRTGRRSLPTLSLPTAVPMDYPPRAEHPVLAGRVSAETPDAIARRVPAETLRAGPLNEGRMLHQARQRGPGRCQRPARLLLSQPAQAAIEPTPGRRGSASFEGPGSLFCAPQLAC